MTLDIDLKASDKNFIILPYDFETLKSVFLTFSQINTNYLEQKLDNNFYKDYLQTLNVKTFVVEKQYIDKDFLNDYASYYVKCFHPYERFCTRLHFFSCEITEENFNSLLTDFQLFKENHQKLQDNYLGYMVIKNLPQSIIGKTCLKSYPKDDNRYFPATVKHKVHLAGIPLYIETLPFQEQDSVVAACATSSLWSMFYGTGELFHHSIPSPYEITKAATQDFPVSNRAFPNHGLSLEMMAKAINKVGLEPLCINADSEVLTKATIYAYLKAHLPVMMGIKLINRITNRVDMHAVTIVGYNFDENKKIDCVYQQPHEGYPFNLRASNISKIYVHDDQVGPFAKMEFGKIGFDIDKYGKVMKNEDGSTYERWILTTSYGMENGRKIYHAIPKALLIPTYHKIRIPFESILRQVYEFNHLFVDFSNFLNNEHVKKMASGFSWEIFLTDINEFKYSIISDEILSKDEKLRLTNSRYPRFLWRVKVYSFAENIFDLIFDATDIEQNEYMKETVVYNHEAMEMMQQFSLLYYERGMTQTRNKIINSLSAKAKNIELSRTI